MGSKGTQLPPGRRATSKEQRPDISIYVLSGTSPQLDCTQCQPWLSGIIGGKIWFKANSIFLFGYIQKCFFLWFKLIWIHILYQLQQSTTLLQPLSYIYLNPNIFTNLATIRNSYSIPKIYPNSFGWHLWSNTYLTIWLCIIRLVHLFQIQVIWYHL